MHAVAAVLASLILVAAENPTTTRPADTRRMPRPIVEAAAPVTPALPAPQQEPAERPTESSTSRLAAPTVTQAPRVERRLTAPTGAHGFSLFSAADQVAAQYRVVDHTSKPRASRTDLDDAAAIALGQDAEVSEGVSEAPQAPPAPSIGEDEIEPIRTSPVVVAAEPVARAAHPAAAVAHRTQEPKSKLAAKLSAVQSPAAPSESPPGRDAQDVVQASTPKQGFGSSLEGEPAHRHSVFDDLKNSVQYGLSQVLPAAHRQNGSPKQTTKSGAPQREDRLAPSNASSPSTAQQTTSRSTATARTVAAAPKSAPKYVRPAQSTARHQHQHHHAERIAVAPASPTPTPASNRRIAVQEGADAAPAPPTSLSNPAASPGPLTGPGYFDYLYTGQEPPPWLRPGDIDPNLRNFWYHTEPRLNRWGKVPHCRTTCNLLPHVEYFPEGHANYYFRPYTFTRALQQQDQAARMGINPSLPYSNEIYEKVYAEFEAQRRIEKVEPGEMPGEIQEFETDTEAPKPPEGN